MEQELGFRITIVLDLLNTFKGHFSMLYTSTSDEAEKMAKLDKKKDGYNGQVRKISKEHAEFVDKNYEDNKEEMALMIKYLGQVSSKKNTEVVLVNKSSLKSYYEYYDSLLKKFKSLQDDFKKERTRASGNEEFVLSVGYNKFIIICNKIISDLEIIVEKLEKIIKKD